MDEKLFKLLEPAFYQTLYIVFVSSLIATVIGLPLGILLYITRPQGLKPMPKLYKVLSFCINVLRSLPFVILMIMLFPLTRLLVGKVVGTTAAIVPIAFSAAPFIARLFEGNFLEIDQGILLAAKSMGTSKTQIVLRVILPEALPSIVNSITITLINVVGYSAMAGLIGGGGLGDVANVYGYQMRRYNVMYASVFIIILLVQLLQLIGQFVRTRVNKKIS